jgi:UPF0716 protein FxsA
MAFRIFLLFTIIPLVELYLLLSLGSAVGFWPTLGTVIITAVLGTVFAKREGLRVVREWQTALSEGRMPEEGVVSGLLVVVAGALLIAPGVLTDIAGLLLMIGPVRRQVARWVEAYARKKIEDGPARAAGMPGGMFTFRVGGMPRSGGFATAGFPGVRRTRVAPGEIVEVTGEVIEERRPDAPRQAASRAEHDVIEGEIVDE